MTTMPSGAEISVIPTEAGITRPEAASRPRQANRDDSLDVAKGFAIILVILGHVLIGLTTSGFFPAGLSWPRVVVNTIYAFHMPVFFVISGYLASGKRRPPMTTIAKMIPTIVYPYFLWSILEGLVEVHMSKYTTSHLPVSVLYKILWIPIIPYWFLYALFVCHLGYLAVRRLPPWWQLAIAGTLFFIPPFFSASIARFSLGIIPGVTRGFLFFVLGAVCVVQIRQFGKWMAFAATAIFALLATVVFQSQLTGWMLLTASIPTATAGVVATLAWARLFVGHGGGIMRMFAFLGRYSMSVYVMHIFFTAGVRILLKRLGAHSNAAYTVLEILAAVSVGILMPLAFNWVVSKLSVNQWFGLQRMETA